MKRFTDWSLTTKITIPFLLVILVFSGNFVVLNRFINQSKDDAVLVDIAARNSMLTQRIAYLTQVMKNDQRGTSELLREAIALYDSSLTVIREGGRAPGFIHQTSAIDEKLLPTYFKLEEHWQQYKALADTIANVSYVLIKQRRVTVTDIDSSVWLREEAADLNPVLQDANKDIQEMNPRFLELNNQLLTELSASKTSKIRQLKWLLVVMLVINLIIMSLAIYTARRFIVFPIRRIMAATDTIAGGNLQHKLNDDSQSEIGRIASSINHLRTKLQQKVNFILQVSKGNYNTKYTPDSQEDELGKALIDMQQSFQESAIEEQKRKEADQKRNWATQALATFADLLRQNTDDMQELSYIVISKLVDTLGANQGSLFVANNSPKEQTVLEQMAAVAYDRRKHNKKQIEVGEGLVGRCYLEQGLIHLNNLPDRYTEITSGLGHATPTNLLLAPLKVNEEILGVVEIASFNDFEKHQVDFVEKVAESIASTLLSVRISSQTARLLTESQQQAEQLASQEETMRRNMEELRETQEEARLQEARLMAFNEAVNQTMIRAEYAPTQELLMANRYFWQKLKYATFDAVKGRTVSSFFDADDHQTFSQIWQTVSRQGQHFEGTIKHLTSEGKDLWMVAAYAPIYNTNQQIEKILFLAIDVTAQKQQNLSNKARLDATEEELSVLKQELNAAQKEIEQFKQER